MYISSTVHKTSSLTTDEIYYNTYEAELGTSVQIPFPAIN